MNRHTDIGIIGEYIDSSIQTDLKKLEQITCSATIHTASGLRTPRMKSAASIIRLICVPWIEAVLVSEIIVSRVGHQTRW